VEQEERNLRQVVMANLDLEVEVLVEMLQLRVELVVMVILE
jgi:hypothetical protein